MVAAAATVVTAVSAAAAVITLLAYLLSLRWTRRGDARDEALALAEIRRQQVIELQERIRELEAELGATRRPRQRTGGHRLKR
jgi:hypothetical protein